MITNKTNAASRGRSVRYCGALRALTALLVTVSLLLSLCACGAREQDLYLPWGHQYETPEALTLDEIPDWSGEPSVVVRGGEPDFDVREARWRTFEKYARLDILGRCGAAYAFISEDLMPDGPIGSIQAIRPTGFVNNEYEFVEGGYLYNRCHLIGYQLTAEGANDRNLITGTRYMNVKGMLPYENKVADHIIDNDHRVLYRVSPVFVGEELVCRGVQMEAYCVDCGDTDDKFMFNVFCYNVQPGVGIDYLTGENAAEAGS